MFITFEGIDYCGKSSQAQLLVNRLRESGEDVLLLREPGNTVLSEQLRSMLLHSDHAVDDRAETMLFEASRAQLVRDNIYPALRGGKTVVCDRFYDSTLAYQGYGRRLPVDFIRSLNRFASYEITPDITFLLHITPEEAFDRASAQNGKDRIEKNDIRFFERVMNGYLRLAVAEPQRFHVIDATQPMEDIHHIIWQALKEESERFVGTGTAAYA
ncbi:MAG TPA: dTMP kinase [Candidatus Kapabacteria bacterium]|nr:dTMP kinase [Candidatus Kapabacteria bacterium]